MTAPAKRRAAPQKIKRSPTPPSTKQTTSKLDALVIALRRPKGARISDLMEVTGWQAHSVRGAMSGALKKKRGLSISSTKVGDERFYKMGSK